MQIMITLKEVLERCRDWEEFCREEGFSEWAVNEGGGHIEVCLTLEKADKYGLLGN